MLRLNKDPLGEYAGYLPFDYTHDSAEGLLRLGSMSRAALPRDK